MVKVLDATVQTFVGRTTIRPEFVHPWKFRKYKTFS